MWLEVFHQNYTKAAERYYERRLEPLEVEKEFARMPQGPVKVASVIDTLEQSTFWSYPKWWPRPSEDIREAAIEIPENLSAEASQKDIVNSLYDHLKNIELVSVILRFLRPKWFGIISIPVTSLISLRQAKHATDYYLRYLASLRKLRIASLSRISDIDMALWSAAAFSQDAHLGPDFEGVKQATEEMWRDEKFQELRLRNLMSGLRLRKERSMYLVFARALLEHDCGLASIVTGKAYESLINEIGEAEGFPPADGKSRMTGHLADDIEKRGIPGRIGIRSGRILECLHLRNRAIHENLEPMLPLDTQRFVDGVSELLTAWEKSLARKLKHPA